MSRLVVTCGIIALLSVPRVAAQAQPPDTAQAELSSRDQIIGEMVQAGREAAARAVTNPFQSRIGPGNRQLVAAFLIAVNAQRSEYGALLKALEAARIDKQVGSAPGNNGSTSLAMKGLAPRILGVALENGAVTRDISGTTLTFRAAPMGLVRALQGQGILDQNVDYATSTAARIAARLSLSASFDIARGGEEGVFTADDQQLSGWSARFEAINGRDPAAREYTERWKQLLPPGTGPYQQAASDLNDALGRWEAYARWEQRLISQVNTRVDAPFTKDGNVERAAAQYKAVLERRLPALETLKPTADVMSALDTYVKQLSNVQTAIDDIYAFVGRGALLTFDWTTTREPSVPDLYTATAVWEIGLGASRKTDFTANGAVSYYRSRPAGAEHRLRAIDVTAQLERPLGNGRILPTATLALGARYSYLPNDTVATTDDITTIGIPTGEGTIIGVAPKGSVAVFQAKLTIPVRDSGIRIPLSITASNRTELIKEREVRGSVGITFDLDAFVSALSGGSN